MKLAVFVLSVCLSLGVTLCTGSQFLYELMRRTNTSRQCVYATPCGWAVCRWRRQFTITPDYCRFVDGTCACPSGTSCQVTNEVNMDPVYNTYYMRCKPKHF